MEILDPTQDSERPGLQAAAAASAAMSPREALAALLIAGARADGRVSTHEANVIDHEVAAMRLFRGCSPEMLQSMFTAIMARIRNEGGDAVLQAAAAAIPARLSLAAFAKTIDLLYSDGHTDAEWRFARKLQTLLGIDDVVAARVVDVLRAKNAA